MNRGRLIARVAADFGLETETGSEELLFLQEWANEAVVDVLLNTHARIEIGELTLTTGQGDYRVDDDVLAVVEIDPIGGYDVEMVTMDEILDARRLSNVPDAASKLAIQGDLFMVYPNPSSGQVIRYYYVHKPTPMTDNAHDPSVDTYGGIPTEHHLAIKAYMDWQASLYDEKRAPQSPRDYEESYRLKLADMRKKIRRKAQRGLAPARVGYPRRSGVPRRNDTYPAR